MPGRMTTITKNTIEYMTDPDEERKLRLYRRLHFPVGLPTSWHTQLQFVLSSPGLHNGNEFGAHSETGQSQFRVPASSAAACAIQKS